VLSKEATSCVFAVEAARVAANLSARNSCGLQLSAYFETKRL
jgi:hypothetical protein